MKNPSAEFFFALVNPGSEKALKAEIESMGLGWRLSYQRRGFVTFKSDENFTLESTSQPLACARRLCVSLGKSSTREGAEELLANAVSRTDHAKFEERQMKGLPGGLPVTRPAKGDRIGTVVELGPAEFWAGVHQHDWFTSPDPAGDGGLVMPPESPSRAWLKLEEAVRFFDLSFSLRDIVVEVGCAPGGVVLALLDRGASVIGVDPAKMADVVMAKAIAERDDAKGAGWFYHCRKPAAIVSKRDLGQGVTWFMSDMNQSPEVVLKECARFCKMAPSIRGVLITLKLTDPMRVVDKQSWFDALKQMGFKTIRLQQFSVHHREFALLALK